MLIIPIKHYLKYPQRGWRDDSKIEYLPLLQRTGTLSPGSTLGDSQPPATPVPGTLMPSSGLHGHLHAHGIHTDKHVHTYTE